MPSVRIYAPINDTDAMITPDFIPSTIAVVRTDRLGDMVLTLPMCAELKNRFPDAQVIVYTRRYVASLMERAWCVDRVEYVDDPSFDYTSSFKKNAIDVIFFPRPTLAEAWAASRAGIPVRIGTGYRWYSLLYSQKVFEHRKDARYHEAEYNVRMIDHVFGSSSHGVQLVAPHIDASDIISDLTRRIEHGTSYTVLHPGSGGSARDWPVSNMAKLAHELHAVGRNIVITGSASEQHLANEIQKQCPSAADVCGKLTLLELMHILKAADCIVCNSTGVIHLGASLGTPVVGLYPTTLPISKHRWGPYTNNAIVLESKRDDDMMTIGIDEVLEAIDSISVR